MIDLEELRQGIRGMTGRQKLYKALKEELSALGYWKMKPRGKPYDGYRKSSSFMQTNRNPSIFPVKHLIDKVAREKALTRANRRCERCGSPDNLIVHHKESIDKGSRIYNEKNSPDNLEVLCRPCHAKLHYEIRKSGGGG